LNWALGSQWADNYQWRVKARNSAGESVESEAHMLTVKPGTPGTLSATTQSWTQINLVWGASADAPGNIDGYCLYRNGVALNTVGSSTHNVRRHERAMRHELPCYSIQREHRINASNPANATKTLVLLACSSFYHWSNDNPTIVLIPSPK